MEFKPKTNTESENKQLEQTMTTSVMVCKKAGCLQDMTYAEPSILLSLVKGIYNGDTKSEVHSKVAQMNLEETVVIDRRDIQSFMRDTHPVRSMRSSSKEGVGDAIRKATDGLAQAT